MRFRTNQMNIPLNSTKDLIEVYFKVKTILSSEAKFFEYFASDLVKRVNFEVKERDMLQSYMFDLEREIKVLYNILEISLNFLSNHREDIEVC